MQTVSILATLPKDKALPRYIEVQQGLKRLLGTPSGMVAVTGVLLIVEKKNTPVGPLLVTEICDSAHRLRVNIWKSEVITEKDHKKILTLVNLWQKNSSGKSIPALTNSDYFFVQRPEPDMYGPQAGFLQELLDNNVNFGDKTDLTDPDEYQDGEKDYTTGLARAATLGELVHSQGHHVALEQELFQVYLVCIRVIAPDKESMYASVTADEKRFFCDCELGDWSCVTELKVNLPPLLKLSGLSDEETLVEKALKGGLSLPRAVLRVQRLVKPSQGKTFVNLVVRDARPMTAGPPPHVGMVSRSGSRVVSSCVTHMVPGSTNMALCFDPSLGQKLDISQVLLLVEGGKDCDVLEHSPNTYCVRNSKCRDLMSDEAELFDVLIFCPLTSMARNQIPENKVALVLVQSAIFDAEDKVKEVHCLQLFTFDHSDLSREDLLSLWKQEQAVTNEALTRIEVQNRGGKKKIKVEISEEMAKIFSAEAALMVPWIGHPDVGQKQTQASSAGGASALSCSQGGLSALNSEGGASASSAPASSVAVAGG